MFKVFQKIASRKLASNQRGIGGHGENAAMKYLTKKGYKVKELNWYNPTGKRLGEIDIIASKGSELVFIEVKTRKVTADESFTLPEQQITREKVKKLDRIAQKYISMNDLWDIPWRIDAVTVIFVESDSKPEIRHLKNIFY
jgi:putative endonuclease